MLLHYESPCAVALHWPTVATFFLGCTAVLTPTCLFYFTTDKSTYEMSPSEGSFHSLSSISADGKEYHVFSFLLALTSLAEFLSFITFALFLQVVVLREVVGKVRMRVVIVSLLFGFFVSVGTYCTGSNSSNDSGPVKWHNICAAVFFGGSLLWNIIFGICLSAAHFYNQIKWPLSVRICYYMCLTIALTGFGIFMGCRTQSSQQNVGEYILIFGLLFQLLSLVPTLRKYKVYFSLARFEPASLAVKPAS